MNFDLAHVGDAFGLQGDLLQAVPYGTGHINDTFVATYRRNGANEPYTFQRINTLVFQDPVALMENIERVSRHMSAELRAMNIPREHRRALRLVESTQGLPFWIDPDGHYWRVYHFIDQARTYDVVETEQQALEAARAVGLFQRLLSRYKGPRLHETIPDFHHTPKRIQAFEAALRNDPLDRAASVNVEIDFVRHRRDLAETLLRHQAAGTMTERITHNDTKINNVLIDIATGEGLCMIDLDTVMPGLALYDFGDLVRTSVSPGAEDTRDLDTVIVRRPIFEALVEGYLEQTEAMLSPAEKECLTLSGRLITFEIGLRFLTDHLNGDVYFKTHRPDHNLDRCRTQFRLVSEIEAQATELDAIVARRLR